jgi:hypothetical protein
VYIITSTCRTALCTKPYQLNTHHSEKLYPRSSTHLIGKMFRTGLKTPQTVPPFLARLTQDVIHPFWPAHGTPSPRCVHDPTDRTNAERYILVQLRPILRCRNVVHHTVQSSDRHIFALHTSRESSDTLHDRHPYRPGPTPEDVVVAPDSGDGRCGRNYRLGWQAVGQQGANIYEPISYAVRASALLIGRQSQRILPCTQDHDDDYQSHVHPCCQLRNTHADYPKAWATIQSLETPHV